MDNGAKWVLMEEEEEGLEMTGNATVDSVHTALAYHIDLLADSIYK